METNNNSIIWARVSSKEQEDTGYSLGSQEKTLIDYADKKSFIKSKIFSVSESASGKKIRETFNEMIEFTKKNNINIIICEKVDRLTRNFKDMVMLDEWLEKNDARQIHLVKDSLILHRNSRSQERLNWGIRMLFAKNYIDNLSEEVRKGQKEKIAQGWLPTAPPTGYKTIGDKGHKIHIIDEEKSPLVVKMFTMYSTGNYSLEKLTQLINDDGLRNKAGKKMSKSQIHALLSNSFYIGKIVWNSQETNGNHDKLIPIDVWDKVQNVLHKKGTPKYSKHNYIFRGLFRCSECGGTIAWETQKNNIYGHCNKYRPCSQRDYYLADEIETQLIEKVKQITPRSKTLLDWVIKAIKENHNEEIVYHNTVMNELNKRLATTKNRLDKIYEDKIDEIITEEKYNELNVKYAKEEKEILKAIEKHKRANAKYYDFGLLVLNITKRAAEILSDKHKPDELKREYYKIIFSELNINGRIIETKFNPAFELISRFNSKIEKINELPTNIFELPIYCESYEKTGSFEPVRSVLLPGSDSNRRPID